MGYFVGIDLHGDNNYIGILDEEDRRVFKRKNRNDIKEITRVLEPYQEEIEVIGVLSEQIDKIEKAVLKEVKLKKPYKKLLTVTGIGEILAMTIMLETGDIERFREVGKNSSYCRCVSAKKVSNGKNKGKGTGRTGINILRGRMWRQRIFM